MADGTPRWSTACPDWAERLKDGRSIIPPPIYPDEAEYALGIFKRLRVADLPGKPSFGECSDQWVFDFVSAIFGAYDAATGSQLIREFFLLISKKNTKSTIAAGIMLTALIIGWREEEEHLILAPTKEVADNSYKPAAAMVRLDDELSALFQVQDHLRTITHRTMRSSLKVVAADTETVSGKKSGRILIDELWLFGTRANAEAMLMEATGGLVSRDEGWVILLSTQSDKTPAGVFKDKLQYYRAVRDGTIIDPKSLGVIYEFPADMVRAKAYLKPENFYITNPNLGRSVNKEWIEDKLKQFADKTDGSFQKFIAKHLNVEIGLSLGADRWAGAEFWEAQVQTDVSLDYVIAHSEVIDVGIDGGGLDDLLGLAVLGRHKITRAWLLWTHAWAHPSVLKRRTDIAAQLSDYAQDGDLTLVSRVGDDVAELAGYVHQVEVSGLLDRVGVDPSGLGTILDGLAVVGIPEDKIIGVQQNYKLQGAIKTAELRLAAGTMWHGGQPLMTWCVGNAKSEQRGNALYITKQAAGAAKIDPLMATFNAVSLMALNPEARGGLEEFLMNPIMAGR